MSDKAIRTTVKGHGGMVVKSWRDLGREGHGREYAGGSPYARQGIFVQGLKTTATKESYPGLSPDRRDRVENPGMKAEHEYLDGGNGVCLTCVLFPDAHDRLMARLRGEAVEAPVFKVVK